MRVLHLGKYYPPCPGGIETFLGDLLPALDDQGVEAAALVHAHDRPEKQRFPVQVWQAPTYGRLLYAPFSPSFPRWLNAMIREFRPEVLHIHVPNLSAFWAFAVPAALDMPWIIHWHADVVSSQIDTRLALAYRLYRPLEQALLRRSTRIIATSPPYRDHSPSLRPWLDKTEMVPLGIDPARLPWPALSDLDWAQHQWGIQGSLRLLCIGRLTYYKGHKILLQALQSTEGVRLLCVGHGELFPGLREQIHRGQLEDQVTLLGQLPDSRRNALLASCDALVLPSLERTEAFGLVLLEAMRYQKPVIASNIQGSGISWVVQEDVTGWLVPPGDPESLAACIETVRKYPVMGKQRGEGGGCRFRDHFHIRTCAQRLVGIYRELMDRD